MSDQKQAPQRSQVGGPPADWKRWAALLDGKPVEACWAWDADAGWVEVWVTLPEGKPGRRARPMHYDRRRLFGIVTPVTVGEWAERIKETGETVNVSPDALDGEPVSGTALDFR